MRTKPTPVVERRFLPLEVAGLELRAGANGADELEGYASVFNQETVIAGLWREEVAPGTFAKTIQEADIRALFNHNEEIVLGRNRAGTLILSEDSVGLRSIIKPPDSEWGRPVVVAVRRRDITGMSIAFIPVKQEWYWPDRASKELPKRTMREAKLVDVSPVTFPAFEQTSISVRAAGFETIGDEDTDILLRARQLARCAQRGLELTRADRELIAEAAEILRSCGPTGEPVERADDRPDHSTGRGGEPGSMHPSTAGARPATAGAAVAPSAQDANGRHSAEARGRLLELLRQTL